MIANIQGGIAQDERGQIRFVNDFDMTEVKRFYIIQNKDIDLVRGWRGHRIEQRWFYVLSGSFSFDLVQIDDWTQPTKELSVENRVMSSDDHTVLYIPAGYATAIRALEKESELLVYSDYPVSHASEDNHVYPLDYFVHRKK